ncbi:13478_t:CDS:2 [Funneliformis caledonium]|uniref:13478_t:CDS:1 n=1 Tax=Funneliformis caledonium TaxID=1117310 RepID=A0A9N9CT99_9GLOM|nr:13478_t:CDS:2 [Funneliformis caledonium]
MSSLISFNSSETISFLELFIIFLFISPAIFVRIVTISSSSESSNLSGTLDITSDIKIRFKQYFDQLMKVKNYTFNEMCYSVVIDIHSLRRNIKTLTVKNFYNSISGSKISTINQINV